MPYTNDTNAKFSGELASLLGIQTASIYSKVEELNETNKSATAATIHEEMQYLTFNQVKNSLRTLERAGYLLSEQPNLEALNHTKFYKVVE